MTHTIELNTPSIGCDSYELIQPGVEQLTVAHQPCDETVPVCLPIGELSALTVVADETLHLFLS